MGELSKKMEEHVQRLLICFVVGLGLLFSTLGTTPASAYYYGYRHYGYGYYGYHHRHRHCWWHHGHRWCRW